jgi:hypothetical protein
MMDVERLGLRKKMINRLTAQITEGEAEYRKLSKRERLKRIREVNLAAPPPDTTHLEIVIEFVEQKLSRLIQDNDLKRALWGIMELQVVLSDLVNLCLHEELRPLLELTEAGLERIASALRQRLLREVLDPTKTPDEVEGAQAAMIELINGGYWPNWKEELDAAVEERRSCAPTGVSDVAN